MKRCFVAPGDGGRTLGKVCLPATFQRISCGDVDPVAEFLTNYDHFDRICVSWVYMGLHRYISIHASSWGSSFHAQEGRRCTVSAHRDRLDDSSAAVWLGSQVPNGLMMKTYQNISRDLKTSQWTDLNSFGRTLYDSVLLASGIRTTDVAKT